MQDSAGHACVAAVQSSVCLFPAAGVQCQARAWVVAAQPGEKRQHRASVSRKPQRQRMRTGAKGIYRLCEMRFGFDL